MVPVVHHHVPVVHQHVLVVDHHVPVVHQHVRVVHQHFPVAHQHVPAVHHHVPVIRHWLNCDIGNSEDEHKASDRDLADFQMTYYSSVKLLNTNHFVHVLTFILFTSYWLSFLFTTFRTRTATHSIYRIFRTLL